MELKPRYTPGQPRELEITVSSKIVNLLSVPVCLILFILSLLLYRARMQNDEGTFFVIEGSIDGILDIARFFVVCILLIALHELIHGLGYRLLGRSKTRYQVQLKKLVISATCLTAMPVNAYRWALILPTLVLSLPLYAAGLATASFPILMMGALHLASGVADYAILFALHKVPAGSTVRDHPAKIGCIVRSADA